MLAHVVVSHHNQLTLSGHSESRNLHFRSLRLWGASSLSSCYPGSGVRRRCMFSCLTPNICWQRRQMWDKSEERVHKTVGSDCTCDISRPGDERAERSRKQEALVICEMKQARVTWSFVLDKGCGLRRYVCLDVVRELTLMEFLDNT